MPQIIFKQLVKKLLAGNKLLNFILTRIYKCENRNCEILNP